jgi:hypothetical protein
MSATRVLWGKNKVALKEIHEQLDTQCVMVVRRGAYGAKDEGVRTFISGAGEESYAPVGARIPFIQDTGRGYGAQGVVYVENYIIFDILGNIIEKANDIGLDEKRPVWVFK